MPQGYRLATVEEIRTNLDMFKKCELPAKRISPSYEEHSGDIRLLDGWVPADFKVVHETPNYNCIWNAVVKTKMWDSTENKWRNCLDFYSLDGNSLRKQQGVEAARLHAYCYEEVEMLYWLWETYPNSIVSVNFTTKCRPQHM